MAKSEVITRKEMKEPDKLQQVATTAARWIAVRRKHVAVAAAIALGLAVVVAIVSAVKARREERAGAAAADLLTTMGGEISTVPLPGMPGPFYPNEEARQHAVIAAAEKVLTDYPGTEAGQLAALALGDAHLKLREWDAAKAAYDRFLSAAPNRDSLRFGGLEGIALAEEGKGNLDAAAQAYARLGREVPAFADRADLEEARVLARAGKAAEARQLLAGFADRHKQSLLAPEASEQLARLGGS